MLLSTKGLLNELSTKGLLNEFSTKGLLNELDIVKESSLELVIMGLLAIVGDLAEILIGLLIIPIGLLIIIGLLAELKVESKLTSIGACHILSGFDKGESLNGEFF